MIGSTKHQDANTDLPPVQQSCESNGNLSEVMSSTRRRYRRSIMRKGGGGVKQKTAVNRNVTFCESVLCIEVPSFLDFSEKEHACLWLPEKDFRYFKKATKAKSLQIQERYPEFQRHLEDAFDGILECCEQQREKTLSFDDSSLKIKIGLRNWCRQSDFRGLEKWVSQDLRSHRELARDSVSFVVALSKVIDDPTQLSKRYQQMSRSYKVFAKLIGDADAITTMANHEEQQFRIEIQKGPTIRNRSVGHHRKINIEPSSRSRYASVVPTIAVRQR